MDQGKLLAIAVRAKSRARMTEIPAGEISMEAGVVGDSRGAPGDRQVTLLDVAAWNAACEVVGHDIPWTTRRANLLMEGLDFANRVGCQVRIGDVVLSISGETDPCQRMDDQVAGLRAALEPDWRGGVCCRVISGGTVVPGMAAIIENSS